MPVKILKVYKGTNLIKAKLANNQIKYGYRWTFEGKKYTRVQWDSKEDAKTAFHNFRARMINPNRLTYDDVEINLDMLLAAWKQRAEKKRLSKKRTAEIEKHMLRFKRLASTDKLRRITEDDLLAYQDNRLAEKKPRHNHTINKEIDMIRTVLRSASMLFPGFNWKPPEIEPLPQLHKGREALLSREQLKKILDFLQMPVSETNHQKREQRELAYDAIIVGAETAMRISEIVGLEKSRIHLDRGIGFKYGFILVKSAKTNKEEKIPMTRNVAQIMEKRLAINRGKFLFKREDQTINPVGQKIRRALKEACEFLQIPYGLDNDGAVFHTLRHSTTTELIVNKKIPMATVMKLTRHSSRTMLMRYTHPTLQAVEEAIEQVQIILDDISESERKTG